MALQVQGGNGFGRVTQSFGTKIRCLLPPNGAYRTRLSKLVYTAGGTEHTITVFRSLGTTTITTAAASGQPSVIVTADPGPAGNGIAAGDLVAVYSAVDGVTRLYVVSSWASVSRTITFTTNLVAAASVGDRVWDFGVEGDTDPVWGQAQPTLRGIADETTTYQQGSDAGVISGNDVNQPLLVSSDNATAQGYLEQTEFTLTTP